MRQPPMLEYHIETKPTILISYQFSLPPVLWLYVTFSSNSFGRSLSHGRCNSLYHVLAYTEKCRLSIFTVPKSRWQKMWILRWQSWWRSAFCVWIQLYVDILGNVFWSPYKSNPRFWILPVGVENESNVVRNG